MKVICVNICNFHSRTCTCKIIYTNNLGKKIANDEARENYVIAKEYQRKKVEQERID